MEADFFKIAYTALGGLGVFFLGLRYLSTGLRAVSGEIVKRLIGHLTANRIVAVLVGLSVTAIVQSSSVSTVMFVSLVNAGLMNLTQAIGVILGANIGTTITGWILAVKIGKYGLLLIGLGIFPMLFMKARAKSIGEVLVALGLVFFGLELMSGAFKPLRTDPNFISYLHYFHAQSLFSIIGCVFVGCLLTFIVQSSSAMLGITIALASTGSITFATAAALVLGENIGTTITAQLASVGASVNAKRAAVSHALFNVIGVAVLVTFFAPYIAFIDSIVPGVPDTFVGDSKPYIAAHIAMGHSVFNITATLLILPFITSFANLVRRLVPDRKEQERPHLKYVGSAGSLTPDVAFDMVSLELTHMSKLVRSMFSHTKSYVVQGPDQTESLEAVMALEEECDTVQQEVRAFVCKTIGSELLTDQSHKAYSYIRAADELESISDYLMSFCRYRKRLYRYELDFGEDAWNHITNYLDDITSFYDETVLFLEERTTERQAILLERAKKLNDKADGVRSEHLIRMQDGSCPPLPALTFSDMIVALRRVKNHIKNFCEALTYEGNGGDDHDSEVQDAA